MALIACPDCGREVSDAATACPQCGRPVQPPAALKPPQVIEQTSKRFKGVQALGCGLMLAGFFVPLIIGIIMSESRTQSNTAMAGLVVATLLLPVGFVLWIVGRARAWWHHG
ncbi:zinc-ribbon domain-containing protein [bacterium]|nr:zinc-ribbon domain-containing protein [bacterium]